MSKLSENIVELRKQNGLTQEQLGKTFNISAQAVSKWENGISEPDIETLKKMCELFNVSFEKLIGSQLSIENNEPKEKEVVKEIIRETKIEQVVGYCQDCKQPIKPQDEYTIDNGKPLCQKCAHNRIRAMEIKEKKDLSKSIKRGLIWGGVIGGGVLAFFLISIFVTGFDWEALFGSLIISYAVFSFSSTLFFSEHIQDIMLWFCKSFTMPGVIFTLDLEGIFFLILVKIGGAILGFLLSILCFLFGVVFTLIYSMFAFPFCLIANIRASRKKL